MGPRIRTTQIKANMAASGRSPSYGGSKKNLSKSKSGKSVGLRALIEGGAKGGGLLGLGGLPARINILIVQGKPRGSGGLFGCFGDGKVYAEEQLELVGNENNPSSEFKLANRLRDNGYEVNTYSLWATDGDIVRHGCVCVNKEVFTCARQFSAHIKFLQDAKVAITPILMPGWEGNGMRGCLCIILCCANGPAWCGRVRFSGDGRDDAAVPRRVADVVHRWRVQGGDRLAGGRVGL
mmetsp:Transcript_28030/g.65390  ORF Transcript_28030/g.65390 Transcript_28030/m.65390 type:complete len:237 (-) Transcript_28030:429-1139(-)